MNELLNQSDHRMMCEIAGADYLGSNSGLVLFRDPDDGHVMSLYAFALRSPDDVKAALKNHREPVQDFEPLLPSEK